MLFMRTPQDREPQTQASTGTLVKARRDKGKRRPRGRGGLGHHKDEVWLLRVLQNRGPRSPYTLHVLRL